VQLQNLAPLLAIEAMRGISKIGSSMRHVASLKLRRKSTSSNCVQSDSDSDDIANAAVDSHEIHRLRSQAEIAALNAEVNAEVENAECSQLRAQASPRKSKRSSVSSVDTDCSQLRGLASLKSFTTKRSSICSVDSELRDAVDEIHRLRDEVEHAQHSQLRAQALRVELDDCVAAAAVTKQALASRMESQEKLERRHQEELERERAIADDLRCSLQAALAELAAMQRPTVMTHTRSAMPLEPLDSERAKRLVDDKESKHRKKTLRSFIFGFGRRTDTKRSLSSKTKSPKITKSSKSSPSFF